MLHQRVVYVNNQDAARITVQTIVCIGHSTGEDTVSYNCRQNAYGKMIETMLTIVLEHY